MRRRDFSTTFVVGLIGWMAKPKAQNTQRVSVVGVLVSGSQSDPETQARLSVVRQRLQELGWVDGQNIRLEYRFLAGEIKRARAATAELLSLGPDVILTHSTQLLTEVQ